MVKAEREQDRVNSVTRSLPVRISLLALRFYKTYLSILFAGNCRFEPTCSQYAYDAIEQITHWEAVACGVTTSSPLKDWIDRATQVCAQHQCQRIYWRDEMRVSQ